MAGNKKHSEITEAAEIHIPKGFTEAQNATVPIKNESGQLEYRALSELGEVGPIGPQGPDASAIQNVVIVQKDPGPNQFSDLIIAMASITDSSTSNPYTLEAGPGIYLLSEPLVLKEGVTFKARGHSTVILEPANTDNDIVQISSSNCRIQGMTLRNATGPNAAAIRIANTPSPAILDFITISNCTEEIVVESSTALTQAVLRNVRLISGSTTKRLLRVQATGGFEAITRFYSGILTDDLGTVFEDAILIDGIGARSDINTLLTRSTVGIGNGVRIRNGGEFVSQTGSEFEGFDKNIYSENQGTAPTIRTNLVMLRNGVTSSLHIEHPGTIGSMVIKADIDTAGVVVVDDDAPLKLFVIDPDPGHPTAMFIRGDILQADKFSQKVNMSKLGRGSMTMGLYSGGELTDGGGLNIDVAAGDGFLTDPTDGFVKEILWEADTLTITPESSVYIFVNSNGIVSQSASLPDLSDNIILGRISTLDTSIHIIQQTPMSLLQFSNKASEMQRQAFGSIYAFGSLVAENGVTARALDISSGSYWFSTQNFLPSGGEAVEFSEIYRKSGSGFNVVTGATQVSNTHYDNGSGTLEPIPAGKFVKHSLYIYGDGGEEEYFLVFGQALFDSLVEAEAGDIPTPPGSFDDAVALIASITIEEGQTALHPIIDERPILGHKVSGVSASANHGNLLGLLGDDHPQYLLANGGRAMSGNLDMSGNNVTNVGLVDGVDVSAHTARHSPNGSDPLSIGSPVQANADGNNNVGTANSYSRSDHKHDISIAAPVTANADGNNNAGSASSVSRSDHKHNVSVAAPTTISDSTNQEGVASSLTRSDHVHAHGNRGGGALHALVTTTVNGFMSAVDKVILNRLRTGFLQYNTTAPFANSTTTFENVPLPGDLSSFPNTFFTKVNDTDFRCDFAGRIKAHYSISAEEAGNNRGAQARLTLNGTPISNTTRIGTGSGSTSQNMISHSQIIEVAVNDIIRLQFASTSGGQTSTINTGFGSLLIEIHSLGLT